jgi:hypothetical protein
MTTEKRTTKLENRYDEEKESGETMKKEILKEFEKEVVDYFWNKETVVGTQRLSSNHIEKIKSFILSALSKQLEEIRDEIEDKRMEDKFTEDFPDDNFAPSTVRAWREKQVGYNQLIDEIKDLISNKLKQLKK